MLVSDALARCKGCGLLRLTHQLVLLLSSCSSQPAPRLSAEASMLQLLLLSTAVGHAPLVDRLRTLSTALAQLTDESVQPLKSELNLLQAALHRNLLDPVDEHGLTRLHHAVLEQDVERLSTLLACGADAEAVAGALRIRPLHLSVLAGDERTACLERLLEAGVAPDAPDAKGTCAVHAASTLNRTPPRAPRPTT